MKKISVLVAIFLLFHATSCVSTKSTIKNIDNSAVKPAIVDNHFVITEYAPDSKYGYDPDYPINLGFDNEKYGTTSIKYFFNALESESKENFTYSKIDTCCPFPTKRSTMGAGTLSVYEVTFEKSQTKIQLYFNIYDKSKLMCPKGFLIK